MNTSYLPKHTKLRGWCRQILAELLVAGSITVSAAATIVDDFEVELPAVNLPTTFSSQYLYVVSPFVSGPMDASSLWEAGTMAIVASSADVHDFWDSPPTVPNPATGGVGFLAVNGSLDAGDIVYQRIVPAVPGNKYTFQFDFTMLYPNASASVEMKVEYLDSLQVPIIGGETTSSPIADTGVNTWISTQLDTTVAPALTAYARITIANSVSVYAGNDFGIDNVAFAVTIPECTVVSGCEPSTNPAGKHIPTAGNNPKSGQNPDGFYKLLGSGTCAAPETLQIFVRDSASDFVAGPFKVGDTVKITQAPGVKGNSKPMAGVVVAHIQLKGDALVYAYDPATQIFSTPSSCYVPPKPK